MKPQRVAARYLMRCAALSLPDAYHVLGLDPDTASPEDIKAKYLSLAMAYHPDRGGSLEKMKDINEAREVIETGGSHSTRPSDDFQNETVWSHFRETYGPKSSGIYSDADLREFAQKVLDANFLQVITRYKVPRVPVDAGVFRGGHWTYYRPFGPKASTKRLVDVNADALYRTLQAHAGTIFDMSVKPREAWVTWKLPDGSFQSISFELVRPTVKKDPNVGMSPDAIHAYMEQAGFSIMAGGQKYSYWGPTSHREKEGLFIREARKTIRLIERTKIDRNLEDMGVTQEAYFGAVTPALLDKWINHIKTKNHN